jgi:thiol-disulfide isomerase/thioredoxin
MRPLTFTAALAVLLAALPDTTARQPDKKTDPKAKVDPKAKDDGEPKFNLKVRTADIRLGTHISGPEVTAETLRDKVVIVDCWGVNCAPCLAAMPGTAALNAELADFGLVVLGSHVQSAPAEQVKAVAASRGANFSITDNTRVDGGNDFQGIPHVMVFDHTGACVYRGDPRTAEIKARLAVGEMLVANAGREKFAAPVAAIAAELKKGQSPALLLPRVVAAQTGTKESAADAKALLASMTAQGQAKFDRAKEQADAQPVEAFLLVEKLPAAYKGTPLAKDAGALVAKLKKDKAVTAELAARPALEAVRKVDAQLAARPGSNLPSAADFQKMNADLLKQLKAKVALMKKTWPDAKATGEAVAIAEKFGAAP